MTCHNCSYFRVEASIKKECLECFKKCTDIGSRTGWDKNTLIECAKNNCRRMFQYVIDKRREEPSHPNIPPEVWNHCPTSYEIASQILTHRNSLWNDYIIKALNESSNQKNIALFKLAIKAGYQDACELIYPYLKPRTSANATRNDTIEYMKAAVFSRQLGMIMWVERTFNESTSAPWPSMWSDDGDTLVRCMMKNKKYYDRLHMFVDTFERIMEKAKINDWDATAKLILSYDNDFNDNAWTLFRQLWFLGGRENAKPEWKNYCIRYNKLVELEYIDTYCLDWPENFIELCDSVPGMRSWSRRNLKDWALRHGCQGAVAPIVPPKERVTNLHKALAVIEECDIPEGKYLELCNLLMDVHRRGVIIM